MTERLYYADAYCTRFTAHVVERLAWEGHPAVVLDRTAFYPTSGGQPADRGTLGGVALRDVVVREQDGAERPPLGVVHVLERALPEAVGEVEGVLDWPRRFDAMQQHTGQHVLSAAFEQVLNADTVGFHLGAEASTIDINAARLDPQAVMEVEELANRVVWEDRPVHARVVSQDELATIRLRRMPAVEGAVRIVDIAAPPGGVGPGFDVNPCGGTHVAHTGEIGLIKVVRLEYRGHESRVEFLCGGRALRDYRARSEIVNRLAALLTVGHRELEQAVERLQGEARQLWHDLRKAQKQLLDVEAAELAQTADVRNPHSAICNPVYSRAQSTFRVVRRAWEGRDPAELRALAQELARRPGMVALLASVGERTHLCFARAEGPGPDVAALLREACARLGGKGGGQPHLAQGSAPVTDLAHVNTVLAGLMANGEL